MTTLGVPRELTGTREQLQQTLARLHEAGVVAAVGPPQRHPHGWLVRVWIRQPAVRSAQVTAGHGVAARGGRPLTPQEKRVLTSFAVGGGVLAVLLAVGWLIVRAVSGAVSAATGNPALAILAVMLAAIGGWKWLTRERPPSSGAGGGCPGITQHCNGCSVHR